MPLKLGGLNIKDLAAFNKSLLMKWMWRGLTETGALWSQLLREKYGNLCDHFLAASHAPKPNLSSIWWRDLTSVAQGLLPDLGKVLYRQLGNGSCVRFWADPWLGHRALKELFPRLYSISLQKNSTVLSMGCWVNSN